MIKSREKPNLLCISMSLRPRTLPESKFGHLYLYFNICYLKEFNKILQQSKSHDSRAILVPFFERFTLDRLSEVEVGWVLFNSWSTLSLWTRIFVTICFSTLILFYGSFTVSYIFKIRSQNFYIWSPCDLLCYSALKMRIK